MGTNPNIVWTAIKSPSHADIAGALAADIRNTIMQYEGQIPLALAVGVLQIVAAELIVEASS